MPQKQKTSWLAVLPMLVIPICLGTTSYLGLSYLIEQEILTNQWLVRYTTGHPISRVTTAMFFIGLASVLLIAANVFRQFSTEPKIELSPAPRESNNSQAVPASESKIVMRARACQKHLMRMAPVVHDHYLWARLNAIVSHLIRTNSTATTEDELKYLSELDLERQQQRYALVRILIWATPMLGFLGTVLGISEALGSIAIGPENNFESMMNGLRGSLYVAFDTTALALTLSMLLMFGLFLVDRFEVQLLALVDVKAHAEVSRHFDLASPETAGIRHFSDEFLATSKQAVLDQTKIWAHSIHSAEKAWAATLTDANEHVQTNLTEALQQNFAVLSEQLSATIDKADAAMAQRWQQWQVTLSDNCRLLSDHQKQLVTQTESVSSLVNDRSGEHQIQDALVQNQQAIQASSELRESLETLAESIQILQTEIKDLPAAIDSAVALPPEAGYPRLHVPVDAENMEFERAADALAHSNPGVSPSDPAQEFSGAVEPYFAIAQRISQVSPEPVVPSPEVQFAAADQASRPTIDAIRQANQKAAEVLSSRRPSRRAVA